MAVVNDVIGENLDTLWDPENPHMHLGTQRFANSDEHLDFLARHGISNMALNTMPVDRQGGRLGCGVARRAEGEVCQPRRRAGDGRSANPLELEGHQYGAWPDF